MNGVIAIFSRSKSLALYVVFLLVFLFGVYAQSSGLIDEFYSSFDDWIYLLQKNIVIVVSSALFASVIGVLFGVLLTRPWFERYSNILMQVFNILSAVPTLAILALIMTVSGIGFNSAFIGLVTVTLLPVVKNTIQGIKDVPAYLIEAAKGQGMTDQQILWKVQIPNALYVITAGIRTGFALNVGTSPLITLIAADSLGEFIFTGIQLNEFNTLLIGSISVALLAVMTDFVLSKLQFLLVPKGVNPHRV